MNKTFAIIKPDAVARGISGKILALIEENGFKIKAMRRTQLTKPEAEGFYAVHKGKGFFDELVEFMMISRLKTGTPGPVLPYKPKEGQCESNL